MIEVTKLLLRLREVLRYILVDVEITSPVIPVKPIPRPKPHEALPVPQDTGHIALGQTALGTDVGKLQNSAGLRRTPGYPANRKKKRVDIGQASLIIDD